MSGTALGTENKSDIGWKGISRLILVLLALMFVWSLSTYKQIWDNRSVIVENKALILQNQAKILSLELQLAGCVGHEEEGSPMNDNLGLQDGRP